MEKSSAASTVEGGSTSSANLNGTDVVHNPASSEQQGNSNSITNISSE